MHRIITASDPPKHRCLMFGWPPLSSGSLNELVSLKTRRSQFLQLENFRARIVLILNTGSRKTHSSDFEAHSSRSSRRTERCICDESGLSNSWGSSMSVTASKESLHLERLTDDISETIWTRRCENTRIQRLDLAGSNSE